MSHSHIGMIIKMYRIGLGMSRNRLAENVCSEKYIYLIEKGEREPATEMTRKLGNKLGVDLFDFYQYLDCADPITVRESIKDFEFYRRTNDFVALKETTDQLIDLPDFQKKPWLYEIAINQLLYMTFIEKRYQEVIIESTRLINMTDTQISNEDYVLGLYIIMSSCYQITGDLPNAERAVLKANEIILNNKNIRDKQNVISVKISLLTFHYLSGAYHKSIQTGNELLQYQINTESHERMNFTFFFLAFAYYETEAYPEAIECFQKGLYHLLISHKPKDVEILSSYEVFRTMLDWEGINPHLVAKFKDKYKLS